jgi:deoxyadenosine/deoxycytidine kinase
MSDPVIISLDGLIGSGKSTLLAEIAAAHPDWEVVPEPVGEWTRLRNGDGPGSKSLLELFYEDTRRWAYTFQNCAILTRLRGIRAAMDRARAAGRRVIITERSVLTDRYVFASMLRADGKIDELEWQLYLTWYETFTAGLPVRGVVYLTTGVGTSAGRIVRRGREGEEHIPLDYLSALDAQHRQWLDGAEAGGMPVLRISTEDGVAVAENIAAIEAFVAGITGGAAGFSDDCRLRN